MAYNHPADDIPLQSQSRTSAKDTEMQDHVYDAPQRPRKRKGAVRFGELGMFGANAKRIPWVVYFFTIVQVAVFIGEIVKNGTSPWLVPTDALSAAYNACHQKRSLTPLCFSHRDRVADRDPTFL
jgi:hypothetical protein